MKQYSLIVSTELGIQIDRSEDKRSANFPISRSDDPDSKVTVSSEEQHEKQDSNKF
jgi:hypothetical protein